MALKEFTTEPSNDRLQTIDFDLDGTVLTARRPKTAAFLALAEVADSDDGLTQVRAVKTFMDECLVRESREYIQDRLDDPEDDFDIENITPIMNWLTSEFTARPTGRPSASSKPRKQTGSRSTARSRSKVVPTPEPSSPNGS